MYYFILAVVLILAQLSYFELAKKYSILDIPNNRSMHSKPIIRGGGIVFFLSFIGGYLITGINGSYLDPLFFLAVAIIAGTSFADDVINLPNRIRLLIYFGALALALYSLEWNQYPSWFIVIVFIVATGAINAYNFMDGINGITASYSFVVLSSFWLVNQSYQVIPSPILLSLIIGVLIFAFFNFRIKAICFAGDVGSITMGLILIYFITILSLQTNNWIWVLFLAVYGVDSVLTIIHRLWMRQNIFQPHRLHLYQVLIRSWKVNPLVMSMFYALMQLTVSFIVILAVKKEFNLWLTTSAMLFVLSIIYVILKRAAFKPEYIN